MAFKREFFIIDSFDESDLLGEDYLECRVSQSDARTPLEFYPELKSRLEKWNHLTRNYALFVLLILTANFILSGFVIFNLPQNNYTTVTVYLTQGLLNIGTIASAYSIYSHVRLAKSSFKVEPLSYNIVDPQKRTAESDAQLKAAGAYEFSEEVQRILADRKGSAEKPGTSPKHSRRIHLKVKKRTFL